MRSGTKNCYVGIYRLTETADPDTNAPIYTPALWRNAWCNALPRKGREVVVDGQIVAERFIRFDFDYLDIEGITELDYILFEGAKYDIKGLLPDLSTKENFQVDATVQPAGTERA